MRLTDTEKKMLQGKMGRLKQKAIESIIQYAEALGAEELCEVTKATLGLGAQPYLNHIESDNYNKIFSRVYMCTEEILDIENDTFSDTCFCQTCTENVDASEYETLGLTKEYFNRNKDFLNITKEAGVSIVSTCAPYLVGWLPLKGEHFVTTESSNAMFCNSIFGACGNPDGVEAAVWSALCGRTPKWGLHIPEERHATHEFYITCLSETTKDWDVIGYTIGRMLPANGIPVITGNLRNLSAIQVKQLFASIATTSGAVMCHIVGQTPEAHSLGMAAGYKPISDSFTVTNSDYDESMELLCDEGQSQVEFVSLGCPHYTLEEIKNVSDYLKGRKIKDGTRFYVWTAYPIKEMARINGYLDVIEAAGGRIFTSSCPLMVGNSAVEGTNGIALDGAKQAHYIRSMTDSKVYYGDMKQCIDAAINGFWSN
jgi:predicted aconitase